MSEVNLIPDGDLAWGFGSAVPIVSIRWRQRGATVTLLRTEWNPEISDTEREELSASPGRASSLNISAFRDFIDISACVPSAPSNLTAQGAGFTARTEHPRRGSPWNKRGQRKTRRQAGVQLIREEKSTVGESGVGSVCSFFPPQTYKVCPDFIF